MGYYMTTENSEGLIITSSGEKIPPVKKKPTKKKGGKKNADK